MTDPRKRAPLPVLRDRKREYLRCRRGDHSRCEQTRAQWCPLMRPREITEIPDLKVEVGPIPWWHVRGVEEVPPIEAKVVKLPPWAPHRRARPKLPRIEAPLRSKAAPSGVPLSHEARCAAIERYWGVR